MPGLLPSDWDRVMHSVVHGSTLQRSLCTRKMKGLFRNYQCLIVRLARPQREAARPKCRLRGFVHAKKISRLSSSDCSLACAPWEGYCSQYSATRDRACAPPLSREHGMNGSTLHAAGAVRNAQQSSRAAASRSEGAGRRCITAKRAARGAPRPLRQPRRQGAGAFWGCNEATRGKARWPIPRPRLLPG